jgi:hypothetical protein
LVGREHLIGPSWKASLRRWLDSMGGKTFPLPSEGSVTEYVK